eukprot:CAMPEP_0118935976 /NCGR_PEP_ID=MMETSP1169-20130426/15933_1 /TAXON_ID=36882 /ORGANISM="Pyramimonas obovata, Strain CCMP722" /LENGTH=360 /DNA_ID=CAMNT_0006879059 /DNA_START=257 /DNA_END=1336 /DNA_ORIENTATION=+
MVGNTLTWTLRQPLASSSETGASIHLQNRHTSPKTTYMVAHTRKAAGGRNATHHPRGTQTIKSAVRMIHDTGLKRAASFRIYHKRSATPPSNVFSVRRRVGVLVRATSDIAEEDVDLFRQRVNNTSSHETVREQKLDEATEEETRGRKHRDTARQRGAEYWAKKVTKLNGRQVQAKAKYLARIQDMPSACTLLREALKVEPDNLFHWTTLGRLEAKQGHVEAARECFKCAMLHGGNESVVTLQANALVEVQADRLDRARYLFREAVRVDPGHAPAWQAWGIMEGNAGRYTKARELFSRANQAQPDHLPTLQAWALLEAAHGELEEARRLLEEALSVDERHIHSWQAWAELEWREGHRRRA